jgi:hypothetical protein
MVAGVPAKVCVCVAPDPDSNVLNVEVETKDPPV